MRSLYIHIPFCYRKCFYCDFTSVPYDTETSEAYMNALIKEMGLRQPFELETLYLGGGTPTALSAKALETLLMAIEARYKFQPGAEITIEANPATLDGHKLEVLKRSAVNRISLGVQSLDDQELKTLGRLHSSKEAIYAFQELRGARFNNISIDLIYGIPGQTLRSWDETLSEVIGYRPEHISAYELTLEACTPLNEHVRKGSIRMPSEGEVLEFCGYAQDKLEKAGYIRYEVSNYALPGRESLHNLNYWRRGHYLGLGAAAHSFIDEERWKNTDDVRGYIDLLDKGILPVKGKEKLADSDMKLEFLLLGLRTAQGISLERATKEFGFELSSAVQDMLEEGFLQKKGDNLAPTRRGFSVLNELLATLFKRLAL